MRRYLRGPSGAGRAALGLTACLCLVATAAAQGLPKAEEVLDKYIEATGGKAAHEKLNNQVAHGKMEIPGSGFKGSMTIYHAVPNRLFVELELENLGKFQQGTDGKVVWEKNDVTGTRERQEINLNLERVPPGP